jgi:hypothetical protein
MTTDAELGAAARSILAEWAPGVNDFQVANRLSVRARRAGRLARRGTHQAAADP